MELVNTDVQNVVLDMEDGQEKNYQKMNMKKDSVNRRKRDESQIPYGYYCYTRFKNGKRVLCPYWSLKEELPEQYNGYCSFLEKSDIDLAKEQVMINSKTGKKAKGIDLSFPTSLLWDQCKECGINEPE